MISNGLVEVWMVNGRMRGSMEGWVTNGGTDRLAGRLMLNEGINGE